MEIEPYQQKLMVGFQAYIEALKHYIQADEPVEQIQT